LEWDQKDLVYLYEQRRNLGFKVVLFCYDVIPVKFPQLCVGDVAAKFALYFANLAWCADKVLCISECSRNDLKALLGELGAPLPDMSVLPAGPVCVARVQRNERRGVLELHPVQSIDLLHVRRAGKFQGHSLPDLRGRPMRGQPGRCLQEVHVRHPAGHFLHVVVHPGG
jgi:hypothetical protein